MKDNILTVMWKERKALPYQQGSHAQAALSLIVPVISIAIVLPLVMGPDWLTTGWPPMASVALP